MRCVGAYAGTWVVALCALACSERVEPLRPDAAGEDGALPTTGGECEPWAPGQFNSSLMLPGRACLECHDRTLGPSAMMVVAGTVFADVQQRDECPGEPGVRVVIVDDEGTEASFTTNFAGNFYIRQTLVFPVRVRLEDSELIRVMEDPVDTGDCNSCHTPTGEEMAPGRIVRPL